MREMSRQLGELHRDPYRNPQYHRSVYADVHSEIDRKGSEAQLRQVIEPHLAKHFELTREVTGFNAFHNKKLKVDLMLKPKFDWHFEYIGVEFKRPARLKIVDYGHWTRQCINYHLTDWGEYGKCIPILMCPGLHFVRYGRSPNFYDNDRDDYFYELTRVMSTFGVGELVPTNRGLEINFCQSHRLWNSWNGLSNDGRKWKLNRKGH